jgi:hypothetical protein
MAPPKIATYREFWPYYLREHSKRQTRAIHLFGTGFATALLIGAFLADKPSLIVFALIAGYGPAWFAHFFVERNRPATFTYPLWSLISDYRMAFAWLTGGLERELEKAGVAPR